MKEVKSKMESTKTPHGSCKDNDISSLDVMCVNTIRFLAADAVQKANSGHPGLPMGAAPIGYVLFNRFLKYNPKDPKWFNRDRFVLSAGHGSMLHYALLYLTGYDSVNIDEIKNFRQLGSKTPGHPENHVTEGVEVTTGPLGQGVSNAVGLAIAEAHLAARFNKQDCKLVDHYTYVLMGDGCQMEGISGEACSLAGHLGLGKLIVFYDDNRITIDGSTDLAFSEDVDKRFEAYGWHVQAVENGDTDLSAISTAIEKAQKVTNKPSLIRVRTTIGFGAPSLQNTSKVHGSPLGAEEIKAARENLKYTYAPFEVDENALKHMRKAVERGQGLENEWNKIWNKYRTKYPSDADAFEKLVNSRLPSDWEKLLPTYKAGDKAKATRIYSSECLNAVAGTLEGIIGGSADLAPSCMTLMSCTGDFQKDAYENRNIRFGIREHAMAAICTGISLHGSGLIPYCSTFMVFSDYMRGALRVAAISNSGVIFIFTHDSLAVGEDGPTHQPIEHLAVLRSIPDLAVIRPADGNETAGAYLCAIKSRKQPTALALTRQNVPNLENTSAANVEKGAYIVLDSTKEPELILIGTGSELHLCVEAGKRLNNEGISTRVVSMPCVEYFFEQDDKYRESILPKSVSKRLVVEAGVSFGWHRIFGDKGSSVSIDRFGVSAPGDMCLKHFGFSADNVYSRAKELLD